VSADYHNLPPNIKYHQALFELLLAYEQTEHEADVNASERRGSAQRELPIKKTSLFLLSKP
jgi:hypothetical protein